MELTLDNLININGLAARNPSLVAIKVDKTDTGTFAAPVLRIKNKAVVGKAEAI